LDTEVEERGADLRGKGFGRRRTGWGPAAEDQSGGMEGRRAGCGRRTAVLSAAYGWRAGGQDRNSSEQQDEWESAS